NRRDAADPRAYASGVRTLRFGLPDSMEILIVPTSGLRPGIRLPGILAGDPVGREHRTLISRAIRRDGRSLLVQPYGHAAWICVLQDALQGEEAAATDDRGLNLVVAAPALQTTMRVEDLRQQFVYGFSFQSSRAIAGISKRSRVRVYHPPSMRPIRSSLSASTCWRAASVAASSLTCTIRILPS